MSISDRGFSTVQDVPAASGSSSPSTQQEAKDKAHQAMGTAQEKGQQVADTAKQKAGQVTDQARATADQGMDTAASGLGLAADKLRQQGEQRGGPMATTATTNADKLERASQYLREKDSDQIRNDLEALVRRKPVEAMLVVAGVGFVLPKVLQ